ncbi:MAG: tryptophan--tRNA ligase [Candidatus Bathyarchaeia archaeon]|nr:tryptophan--tRNA ligase [Candidatus Bathyarchaeota archaeon]
MAETGNEGMTVTPWEVSGEIDYAKLVDQFGTQLITDDLLDRLRGYTGDLHFHLTRRVFFSHRDLDYILDLYDEGIKFVLYTGRGPSGDTHIGHIIPWIFTKWLQDKFHAKLYFQLTDDEKFLINPSMNHREAYRLSYENALDVIAVGFDKKNTVMISNMRNAELMYNAAIRIARHVTGSTAKAVFGFTDSSNIGIQFFPAMQAVPCFLESLLTGENVPSLIPAAIDQDPYWRIARDVAPKLGFYKPAQIHSRFLPGLGRGGKMSSSMPETCIFLVDKPEVATRKIMDAFTGGRATVKEQKMLGGDPSICSVFQYEYFLLETDDEELRGIEERCRRGELLCGEHKCMVAEKVIRFLKKHQENREKAKDVVQDIFLEGGEYLKSISDMRNVWPCP